MKTGRKAEAMSKTGSEAEARFLLDAKMDVVVARTRTVCITCSASSVARG
jgi:hypothetical protein